MNVGEVEQSLVASGHPVEMRSALLASGLLLMPLLSATPPTSQANQGWPSRCLQPRRQARTLPRSG